MTNLLIASFKEEAEAIEASHKLNELETIGDITVYEMVVIEKNADGQAVILQADTDEGVRTMSGMAIGTLVGSLAGPVRGGHVYGHAGRHGDGRRSLWLLRRFHIQSVRPITAG